MAVREEHARGNLAFGVCGRERERKDSSGLLIR